MEISNKRKANYDPNDLDDFGEPWEDGGLASIPIIDADGDECSVEYRTQRMWEKRAALMDEKRARLEREQEEGTYINKKSRKN